MIGYPRVTAGKYFFSCPDLGRPMLMAHIYFHKKNPNLRPIHHCRPPRQHPCPCRHVPNPGRRPPIRAAVHPHNLACAIPRHTYARSHTLTHARAATLYLVHACTHARRAAAVPPRHAHAHGCGSGEEEWGRRVERGLNGSPRQCRWGRVGVSTAKGAVAAEGAGTSAGGGQQGRHWRGRQWKGRGEVFFLRK